MAKKRKQTHPKRLAQKEARRAVQSAKRRAANARERRVLEEKDQIASLSAKLAEEARARLDGAGEDPLDTRIDNLLQNSGALAIRQFFGGAAKFLIPSRHWNDPAPTTRANNHRKVQEILSGFTVWNTATLAAPAGPDDLVQAMRRAARVDRFPKMTCRDARARLSDLRKRWTLRCKRLITGETRPEGGLRLYELTLKRKYYPDPLLNGSVAPETRGERGAWAELT